TSERKELSTDELVRLYDSDGVTPEQLIEAGAKVSPPEGFYEKVQARHLTREVEEPKLEFDTRKLPPTKLWYYEEGAPMDFSARVLKVFQGKYVVLDRTVFYPRGGGQEPDRGTLGGAKVVDIEKYGDIVIHKVEGKAPRQGARVQGHVDQRRRRRVTQIHTATHIVNGSSRQVLGPWVWQHSAFKEEDYGRIDITHFSHLTEAQVQKIEDVANEIVRRDLKVKNTFMPRSVAEKKYGFRLYQGGVVPGKLVRVVDIGGWDIEACGGTHSKSTGEVGLIKITKAERIQDGVERLEFVAGEAAIEYMHRMDSELQELVKASGYQRENLAKGVGNLVQELTNARGRVKALEAQIASGGAQRTEAKEVSPGVRLQLGADSDMSQEGIILRGQNSVRSDPSLVFVNVASTPNSARIVAFSGAEAAKKGVSASEVVKKLAEIVGGSGGGSPTFAQGGGPRVDQTEAALKAVEGLVRDLVKGQRT
ncbi:MAG TPA: alanine--tRNA ligase-related protein, partial [Nitrososphaerales archaeon]|nr:alanine--tRNA ligase-related protein [Nitrososphaerales archaeon]